jgi:Flp pilus assembly protein TadG
MEWYNWQDQKGAVSIVIGLMLAVLLGFVGLALDLGNVVLTKSKMQNAVDAAACAGALKLMHNPPSALDQSDAAAQANAILHANGFPSVTLTPTYEVDPTYNTSNLAEINLSLTSNVSTNFMRALGISNVPVTVVAKAVSKSGGLGKPFDYTLFSTTRIGLSGSGKVIGNIHANTELDANGSQDITGNVETGTSGTHKMYFNGASKISGYAQADVPADVVTNGNVQIGGGKIGGGDDVPMPDFSQAIMDAAAATPGTVFNGDATFNGAQDLNGLAGTIYASGNVYINGSLNWSGTILAGGNIVINGSATLAPSNQVFLYSKTGSVFFNGSTYLGSNASSSVIIYAPNGMVNMNGSSKLYGRVYAHEINYNGSGDIDGRNADEISVLPPGVGSNKTSKLIR